MLFGGLCENLESIHETEDEIRHKAIQTALLSFLMNLFSSTNISPSRKTCHNNSSGLECRSGSRLCGGRCYNSTTQICYNIIPVDSCAAMGLYRVLVVATGLLHGHVSYHNGMVCKHSVAFNATTLLRTSAEAIDTQTADMYGG
jgi:hypothetical protein